MRTAERLHVPLGVRPHGISGPKRTAGVGTLVIGGVAALALLVLHFDAPPVLAAGIILLALAPAILWPDMATVFVVFLLYINFPAILTKQVGLPDVVAGGFIGLLLIPLAYQLLVRNAQLRADRTLQLMLALLVVMLISSLRAVDGAVASGRIVQYLTEGVLLFWLFTNVVRTRVTLQRALWALLAAGALLGSLSLYQDITGSYQQEFGGLAYRNYAPPAVDNAGDSVSRRQTWDRAQGPVDEPNRFAQIMIVLLPLALVLYRNGKIRSTRILAAAAGLLILAGVTITLSRGAFVALLLMALTLGALGWIRWRRLAITAVLVLVAVPVISPHYLPRMMSIVNVTHLLEQDRADQQQADGAIRGRMTSTLTALHVFRDHPLLGVGPGQFRSYYAEYSDNPDIKFRDIRSTRRAHNLYAEMGAEIGLAGLTIFMAIALLLMRDLWRERTRWRGQDHALTDFSTALVLSLCAYLITGVFLHLSFQRYYWFLVALAAATLYIVRLEHDNQRAFTDSSSQIRRTVPAGVNLR